MRMQSVLHFLLFTCFLVIGYTFSIRFYQPVDTLLSGSIRTFSSQGQKSITTLDNGQRSVLVIQASSTHTNNPRLESVWLLSYLPTDTTIQWLPVFPSGKKLITDFEKQMDAAFRLIKVGDSLELDDDFLRLLEQNNYWWSGYIIFDRDSLAKALNLIGGLDMNGKTLSGTQVINSLPDVIVDSQQAFSAQIAVLQSMCHKVIDSGLKPGFLNQASLLPGHVITDLDTSQLQLELEAIYSSEHHLNCRFPTLEVSRTQP
jgi:hypothetical protein